MEVTVGLNIDEEDNDFQPHNNYAYDEQDNNEKDGVFENWEWEPVTDDMEIPDIPDHNDGPHGMKAGVEKTFYIIIE